MLDQIHYTSGDTIENGEISPQFVTTIWVSRMDEDGNTGAPLIYIAQKRGLKLYTMKSALWSSSNNRQHGGTGTSNSWLQQSETSHTSNSLQAEICTIQAITHLKVGHGPTELYSPSMSLPITQAQWWALQAWILTDLLKSSWNPPASFNLFLLANPMGLLPMPWNTLNFSHIISRSNFGETYI